MFSDVLYMLVRYGSPSGPMCLRCLLELLFLLSFITTCTYVVVSVMLVVCSLSVSYLCVCLFCAFYV